MPLRSSRQIEKLSVEEKPIAKVHTRPLDLANEGRIREMYCLSDDILVSGRVFSGKSNHIDWPFATLMTAIEKTAKNTHPGSKSGFTVIDMDLPSLFDGGKLTVRPADSGVSGVFEMALKMPKSPFVLYNTEESLISERVANIVRLAAVIAMLPEKLLSNLKNAVVIDNRDNGFGSDMDGVTTDFYFLKRKGEYVWVSRIGDPRTTHISKQGKAKSLALSETKLVYVLTRDANHPEE